MEVVEQIVIFNCANNEFAFDIMKVQEIIRYKKITDVPQSDPFLLGVVNLRGSVLPVIDFLYMIKKQNSKLEKNKRIIIVEIEGNKVGVLVDSVREVLRVSEESFEELISQNKTQSISNTMIKLNDGERIISLINQTMFHDVLHGTEFEIENEEETDGLVEGVAS